MDLCNYVSLLESVPVVRFRHDKRRTDFSFRGVSHEFYALVFGSVVELLTLSFLAIEFHFARSSGFIVFHAVEILLEMSVIFV